MKFLKRLLELLVIFLLLGGVMSGDPCSDGTYQNGQMFAVEECSQTYYQCNHGDTLERSCAAGTLYDSATGCNHPKNIGCEEVISGDPCSEGKYSDGTLYLYEECSEYYNECVHGKTMKRPCAPGTVFDPNVGVCNHPRDVDGCEGDSAVSDSDGCRGHEHGDLYVPDDGCYPYFYQCSHGTEYKFDCPSSLVFDVAHSVCNWPSDVSGCGGNGGCNGHSNGEHYVDDVNGCFSFYYVCNHGSPVKFDCPANTAFNPDHLVCDHLYNIPACSNDNGCHGHNHGDLYIPDDNCYPFFYQCVHGKAYQMPCPNGLIFDTTIERCNWPNEVEGCDGDSNMKTTTTRYETTPPITEVFSTTPTTTAAAHPSKRTYVGFVIDDTGSMRNEIKAAKRWLKRCVKGKKFLCGTAPTGGWIVTAFNDPDAELVVGPTTNVSRTLNAIDSLTPHGGWDCPEMAMSGLQTALEAVPDDNDGCKIFFFSDAIAKDIDKVYGVSKLFLKKRCVFIPVLTSCCGSCLWPCLVVKSGFCEKHVFERTHAIRKKRSTDDSDRPEVAYYQLAEETGGDIFILPKPKSSKVMATVLSKSATLGMCGTTLIAGPSGHEYSCEADCIAMKMCWDRSTSKCYCPSVGNCATNFITKSRCKASRGQLLCDPNVSQDYFADVARCDSFFTCKWGKATHHQCDQGKVFTPTRDDHCDIPKNAPGPCGNGQPYPDIFLL